MNKELKALELIKLDYGVEPQGYEIIKSALEQLEEHKQIEQELGIDLITLIKALVNGVYVKSTDIDYHKIVGLKIKQDGYYILARENYLNGGNITLYLKYYGKTWALTRKELEQ